MGHTTLRGRKWRKFAQRRLVTAARARLFARRPSPQKNEVAKQIRRARFCRKVRWEGKQRHETKSFTNSSGGARLTPILALPTVAGAQIVSNPSTPPDCMNNTAFFNPTLPPSINLPPGFTASVFVAGLNQPTGIAFLDNASNFHVFVLESGHGLPSTCNDETLWPGGVYDIKNPFTPDLLVFD
jgi:hypothetical protein